MCMYACVCTHVYVHTHVGNDMSACNQTSVFNFEKACNSFVCSIEISACPCVCTFMYGYVCMYLHVDVHVLMRVLTCVHSFICIHTHVSFLIHTFIYVCVYMHTYMRAHVYTHIQVAGAGERTHTCMTCKSFRMFGWVGGVGGVSGRP